MLGPRAGRRYVRLYPFAAWIGIRSPSARPISGDQAPAGGSPPTRRHQRRIAVHHSHIRWRYAERIGHAPKPPIEAMLRMTPLLCLSITRPAAWIHRKTPLYITSTC